MFADLLDLILPNLCRRPSGQDIHHNDQWPAVLAYGEEHEAITELYGYSEREADEDIVQLITELQGGKEISPGGNLQHISRHTPGAGAAPSFYCFYVELGKPPLINVERDQPAPSQ